LRPEFDLEAQKKVQALTLGTVLAITVANATGELVCTLALIDFQRFK